MKKILSVFLAALFITSQAFAAAPAIPPHAPVKLYQPNIVGPATVRQVTNRTGIPNQISGTNTKMSGRSWQMAYVPVSALKVCIPNYYVSSATSGVETTPGGSVSAHIVVEYPHGTFKDLTWGGTTPGTVTALSNGCTDLTDLGFTIPAYAKFRINYFLDWSGGAGKAVYSSWSNACDKGPNGDEFTLNTVLTDHSSDDTIIGVNTPANCWFPGAVMARSDRAVWWLIGDSLVAGVNDLMADPSGGRGLLGRAAASLGPQLNLGVPGDRANWYATGSNASLRTALAATAGATSALLELGVNDFFAGTRTADNVLTDRASVRTKATTAIPGIRVYDTTVTPETTSTDGWNTTVNQTTVGVGANNSRMAFNDFLRGVTSYTATCTLAGTTAVTGCTGLTVTTAATGMYASGTNLPASDVITAINQYAGTFTLTTTASGSGATTVTFSWPTFSTSWPTSSAGLIDIARLVECAPNQAGVLVANGGVWCVGYVGQTDGIHTTSFGLMQVQQLLTNQLAVLR
jgi:lysophospholipase L1-like esterase